MQTVIVTTQYVNPTLFFGKQQMLHGAGFRVQGSGFRVLGGRNLNPSTNQLNTQLTTK
jgi:hypothetical protein